MLIKLFRPLFTSIRGTSCRRARSFPYLDLIWTVKQLCIYIKCAWISKPNFKTMLKISFSYRNLSDASSVKLKSWRLLVKPYAVFRSCRIARQLKIIFKFFKRLPHIVYTRRENGKLNKANQNGNINKLKWSEKSIISITINAFTES